MQEAAKIGHLTTQQKLLALQAVSPSVSLAAAGRGWQLSFGNTRFQYSFDPACGHGDTPERAINEAWFWLTGEDYERDEYVGRAFAPARPNAIIQTRTVAFYEGSNEELVERAIDVWWRWGGWMWEAYVIQRH